MRRTRLSLFYLAGYLLPTGLALMFAPGPTLRLLFSNGDYGDVMPRLAGCLLFGLGILVVRCIQVRAEGLYPATLLVRAVIWCFALWLYVKSGDPLFLVLLGVVGLGMIFTGLSYFSERHS